MSAIKTQVKQYVNPTIWRYLSIYKRSLLNMSSRLRWYISPFGQKSRLSLERFYNIHQGERCFIIGNGPSLKQTDLSYLNSEFTFGLNRIYLLFDMLGFSTSYYLSVNQLVVEQCADEIVKLTCPKFISWQASHALQFDTQTTFLYTYQENKLDFCYNVIDGVSEGATVTYVAMQLAYYMGFQQVILIGVDHSFNTKGFPNQTITSDGDDLNHFSPQYFGKGFRWQLPDLATSELAYQQAKVAYEQSGREIIDATINGKLQVFNKVDYCSLF